MTVAFLHTRHGRAAVRGLSFAAVDSGASVRTVSVRGEVDACNAKDFAVTVCELAAGVERLTLDLSRLDFIAIDGCAALHSINLHMMRADTGWQVLPSPAVARLLALCDREGLIPAAGDVRRVKQPA